jgi:hypothetical protein
VFAFLLAVVHQAFSAKGMPTFSPVVKMVLFQLTIEVYNIHIRLFCRCVTNKTAELLFTGLDNFLQFSFSFLESMCNDK